jgi:hypothetical protein
MSSFFSPLTFSQFRCLGAFFGLALASPVPVAWGQQFAPVVAYSTGPNSGPQGLVAADLNSDGHPDLVTANYVGSLSGNSSGAVEVLLGTGTGTFRPVVVYSTGSATRAYSVAVADLNADGKLDILVGFFRSNLAAGATGILFGNGNGTFQPVVIYATGPNTVNYSVGVADVNADGKPDIITAGYVASTPASATGAVGVQLNNGNGRFLPVVTYPTGNNSAPAALRVADVNADGRPDLVVADSFNSTVGVLLGNSLGTLQPVTTYSVGSAARPLGLAVVDVNADGRPDILTANYNTNAVSVLLNAGAGTWQAATSYPVGTGLSRPRSIAGADFNRDGNLDIVTANEGSDTVSLLLGTGTGTFQSGTTLTVGNGSGPYAVVAADMNADTHPDIMTANYYTDAVGLLLNSTVLATRPGALSAQLTLAPNPAQGSTTLWAAGLPAEAHRLEATLLNPIGQIVRQFSLPATQGAVQTSIPTAGLAPGLYLLRLHAQAAQGQALGSLPTQRLSVH